MWVGIDEFSVENCLTFSRDVWVFYASLCRPYISWSVPGSGACLSVWCSPGTAGHRHHNRSPSPPSSHKCHCRLRKRSAGDGHVMQWPRDLPGPGMGRGEADRGDLSGIVPSWGPQLLTFVGSAPVKTPKWKYKWMLSIYNYIISLNILHFYLFLSGQKELMCLGNNIFIMYNSIYNSKVKGLRRINW